MLFSHHVPTFNLDQLEISWHPTNNLVSEKHLSLRAVEESREMILKDFPSVDKMSLETLGGFIQWRGAVRRSFHAGK